MSMHSGDGASGAGKPSRTAILPAVNDQLATFAGEAMSTSGTASARSYSLLSDAGLNEPQGVIHIGTDFVISGDKWDHGVITWSLATANYDYQQGENFAFGFTSGGAPHQKIAQAFQIWDNASTYLTFQQVADSADVDIRLGWGNNLPNDGADNTLGVTWNFTSGTIGGGNQIYDRLTASLIMVDSADGFSDLASGTSADKPFLNVVLHEIGHSLGFGHYDLNPAIMNTYASNMTSLTSHEINGISYLYPGGTPGTGTPDYTCAITSVSSTSGAAGQTITVNFRITNSGQRGDGPEFKIYLSQDQVISPLNEVVDHHVGTGYRLTAMDSGETHNSSITFTVPTGISGGWYLGMVVDPGGYIAETNNNNNVSNLVAFTVNSGGGGGGNGADLQVSGFTLNSTGWTAGQAITGTYTVTNAGNQAATGSGYNYLMISPDATVSSPQDTGYLIDTGIYSTPLAAGQSITRNFSFTPAANQFANGAGQYYVAIFADGQNNVTESNNNNNIGQSRVVSISIPVVAPEIAVSGNGTNIVDGDTTPSATDFTSFGAVVQGSGAIVRTFTVSNTGNATLTTSGLTLPTGFTLVEGLSASIAAGSSDTFQVRLDTTTAGTKSGQISFTTNDSNENPFNFSVTGTVNAPAIPDDFADSWTDTASPLGQLATNAQRAGNIEIAGDRDWFRVDLIAGQTYIFRLQGQDSGGGLTLGDPYLRLYGVNGKQLAFNDDANALTNDSQIAYTAKSGGSYYLEAAAFGTGLGTYKILSAGPQTRDGGSGADIFTATANAELFFGQAGSDTVTYAAANAPVVVSLLSATKNTGFAAGDSYNSIENLRGSAYADTLIGNTLDNVLEGGAGADSMNGGAGIDTASYANAGAGVHADLQYPQNNTGDAQGDTYKLIENLLGSAQNDFLGGDKKVNALDAANGNDVLYGGFGADRLTGGAGFDSFNFGWAKEGGDVITDFQAGIDEIGIYRTGFGINSTVDVGGAGAADFAAHYFVGSAGVPSAGNPSGVAPTEFGHGQFLFNQTNDTLWWDSDGAGKAKAVLLATFATNVNLTATDFDLY